MKNKIVIIGQVPKEYGGSYTTGVANVIINVISLLSKTNWDSFLWASNSVETKTIFNTKVFGIKKKQLPFLAIKYFFKYPKRIVTYQKYKKFGIKPLRNLIYEICINELIKKVKPNVIHVHNIGLLPATFFANNQKESNILLTFHGVFYKDKNSIEQSKKIGIDIRKIFTEAPKLVSNFTVLTEAMKKEVIKLLKISPNKIDIVPNGVKDVFYYDELERKRVREKLKFSDSDIVFINVGALTKRKNQIGAIRFLQNNGKNFKFIIIGKDGDSSEEVKEEVVKDSRILLLPYVDNKELYKYYSAADFFMMASTQEGQALVCLEAFSCGLHVLINKDIKETLGVRNSFNSYFTEIDLMKRDSNIPLRMSEIERRSLSDLSKRELIWENVTHKYLNVYNEIYYKNN